MTSKKDIDKMNEFKLIMDGANSQYQDNLSIEREGRRAQEFEIEKLKREIQIRSEGRISKAIQTTLKWVDSEAPVKASFW